MYKGGIMTYVGINTQASDNRLASAVQGAYQTLGNATLKKAQTNALQQQNKLTGYKADKIEQEKAEDIKIANLINDPSNDDTPITNALITKDTTPVEEVSSIGSMNGLIPMVKEDINVAETPPIEAPVQEVTTTAPQTVQQPSMATPKSNKPVDIPYQEVFEAYEPKGKAVKNNPEQHEANRKKRTKLLYLQSNNPKRAADYLNEQLQFNAKLIKGGYTAAAKQHAKEVMNMDVASTDDKQAQIAKLPNGVVFKGTGDNIAGAMGEIRQAAENYGDKITDEVKTRIASKWNVSVTIPSAAKITLYDIPGNRSVTVEEGTKEHSDYLQQGFTPAKRTTKESAAVMDYEAGQRNPEFAAMIQKDKDTKTYLTNRGMNITQAKYLQDAKFKQQEFEEKQRVSNATFDYKIKQATSKAEADKLTAEKEDSKTKFAQATTLRKEFTSKTKVTKAISEAFNRVVASVKNPTAAGDLALIFNYMKMLDPGSVVREGEFATAKNSGSAFDIVGASYNKIVSGQRLTQAQRDDFFNRAGMLSDASTKEYKDIVSDFGIKAQRNKLNPNDVVPEGEWDKSQNKKITANDLEFLGFE